MKQIKILNVNEDKASVFFALSDQRMISIPKERLHLAPKLQESTDNIYEINSEGNIVSCKLLDLRIYIEDILSPGDVQDVIGLKFHFSDVVYLDNNAIQKVLRETDSSDLCLALSGSELIGHYAVNMSTRAFQLFSDDLEYMTDVIQSDQQKAQFKIEILVNSLIDNGEIVFSKDITHEREVPTLEEEPEVKTPFQINYPILFMFLIIFGYAGYVTYENSQLKNSINLQSKTELLQNK